ncbi:TIGR02450 family Trp-rich protein [Pseudomonas lalucatii]|uniref:TIGR02450 family Trp-rich protein n=1 Tax=Pseudomonas lalucatii TaxID=1424203 RepID=A0ABS5PZY0_9PSED|nr:TIGR02450 family Trp-rich protein [Pseudomonas lalucatii]MBS7661894.1 TIGR02450 family Trp-rich protein [Pseudomonas lalucatii]MBS7690577.1 TIGR02450 family Trp-rich protein [Pseudomonas lalucatii]MBS7726224.1 TIGR02450 family Trp-rich protein [Pseudomonas lalucatii]QVM88204.1 TIGR02450 family Trp-rich protein [Pseudomonas lalucatii]
MVATPPHHRLNPAKLPLSKWTAVHPRDREKHFLVVELLRDEDDHIVAVELQAVLSRHSRRLPWRALQDARHWRMGWQ